MKEIAVTQCHAQLAHINRFLDNLLALHVLWGTIVFKKVLRSVIHVLLAILAEILQCHLQYVQRGIIVSLVQLRAVLVRVVPTLIHKDYQLVSFVQKEMIVL